MPAVPPGTLGWHLPDRGGRSMPNNESTINRLSPKKLLRSKWTAVEPRKREKHFLVTRVITDDDNVPRSCVLEAVHSRREIELDWRELKNREQWRVGWR